MQKFFHTKIIIAGTADAPAKMAAGVISKNVQIPGFAGFFRRKKFLEKTIFATSFR
jgi:hypothetical protein